MKHVTISSKGQIAIPKAVREALNLSQGAKLVLELRGQEIVLSKQPAWRELRGTIQGESNRMIKFAAMRKQERAREDSSI